MDLLDSRGQLTALDVGTFYGNSVVVPEGYDSYVEADGPGQVGLVLQAEIGL